MNLLYVDFARINSILFLCFIVKKNRIYWWCWLASIFYFVFGNNIQSIFIFSSVRRYRNLTVSSIMKYLLPGIDCVCSSHYVFQGANMWWFIPGCKCITWYEYDVSHDNLMVQISLCGNHFIKCYILTVIIWSLDTLNIGYMLIFKVGIINTDSSLVIDLLKNYRVRNFK